MLDQSRDAGSSRGHLLEVVEHDQHLTVAKAVLEGLERLPVAGAGGDHRSRDRRVRVPPAPVPR